MKIKLFKKYPIVTQTVDQIIEKIKESTDYHFMIERESISRYGKADKVEKETTRHFVVKGIRFHNNPPRVKTSYTLNDGPIVASTHSIYEEFRTAKENGESRINHPWYKNEKPLIHLRTDEGSALVLYSGDFIRFLPFGGFIVYTSNKWNYYSENFQLTKYIYIPNTKKRISSIEEIDKQWDREAEEIEEILMKMEEEDGCY